MNIDRSLFVFWPEGGGEVGVYPEDGVSCEEREGEAGLRDLEAGVEVANIVGVQKPDRVQQATSSEMSEDGVNLNVKTKCETWRNVQM